VPHVSMSGAKKEVKETTMNMIGKTGDEVVGKGVGNVRPSWRQSEIDIGKEYPEYSAQKSFKKRKRSTLWDQRELKTRFL
jgi:hypothetical protein